MANEWGTDPLAYETPPDTYDASMDWETPASKGYAGAPEGWGGADYLAYERKPTNDGPQLTWGGGDYTNAAKDMPLNPWGATSNSDKTTGGSTTTTPRTTTSRASSATSTKPTAAQIHPLKIGGYSTSTTEMVAPGGPTPEYGAIPDFVAPEWDEREINRMTQQKAAPGVRKLRGAVQQAMGRSYENPNVGRMTLRDALAGYGLGLEGVMAGAGSQALGEYGRKYQTDYQGATTKYTADRQAQASVFNAAWNNYLKGYTQKTTQTENSDYDLLNLTPDQGFTRTNLGQMPVANPTGFDNKSLIMSSGY